MSRPMASESSRLLILARSDKKRPSGQIHGQVAAIDLYDGPEYRLLHRYLAQNQGPAMVCVLTAEYGLINGQATISSYARDLTAHRAAQLSTPGAVEAARRLVHGPAPSARMQRHLVSWAEVFAYTFGSYRTVIEEYAALGLFGGSPVAYADSVLSDGLNEMNRFLARCAPA